MPGRRSPEVVEAEGACRMRGRSQGPGTVRVRESSLSGRRGRGRVGVVLGEKLFAIRLKLRGSQHALAARIFLLLVLPSPSPLPGFSVPEPGEGRACGQCSGWTVRRRTPARSLLGNDFLPSLCCSLLLGSVSFFSGVNIMALDDMTPGIDLRTRIKQFCVSGTKRK